MSDDLTPEDIADGMALWEEHKPQSGDDWLAVARRSVEATDYDPSAGSPLFQALYAAVDGLMEYAQHTSWRCEHPPHFYLADKAAGAEIAAEGDCFCGLLRLLKRIGLDGPA